MTHVGIFLWSSANRASRSKQPVSLILFLIPLYGFNTSTFPPILLSPCWPQFVAFTWWLGHRDALIMVHSRSHHKAEWHSFTMERLCPLCDWLPVNKEVSTAWGLLWWVREDQRGGLWERERERERREGRTRAENWDLFICCRKKVQKLKCHIYCLPECICITKLYTRLFQDGMFPFFILS